MAFVRGADAAWIGRERAHIRRGWLGGVRVQIQFVDLATRARNATMDANLSQLGAAFTSHYYTTFDTNRAGVVNLYVRPPPPPAGQGGAGGEAATRS